eukprot:CAMPEP_0116937712 /NCGR_PEP_ID=MMETSP0467-20121206/31664_1 /TAXON_ID=283647 /ORGANISM="Mesodinium pulex, Strain SPMC105" /LENGTH=30 /DNA_ID= /DNA_START= /DNA_END= /DNA_ORIENTATION=
MDQKKLSDQELNQFEAEAEKGFKKKDQSPD